MPERSIWKIALPMPGDLYWENLPGNWRILGAGVQGDSHVAWVEVEPGEPLVSRPVHVIGTGWPVPRHMHGDDVRLEHRATYQWGSLVWHVLEGVAA
jgi:hypothetical protein